MTEIVTLLVALSVLLVALSVASERLTDILKNKLSFLEKPPVDKPSKMSERTRTLMIQILSLSCSCMTVWIAQPMFVENFKMFSSVPGMIVLSLMISGGSSFWNSLQGYMINLKKDIKTIASEKK